MLPRITVKNAGPGSLAVLMDLWHRTWYPTVTPEAHHAYRMHLFTTPWARKNLQVLVLEENGAPHSGLIALSFPMRLDGVKIKMAGIAAVVTHPEQRGRGLAARLLTIAHRRLADSGHDASLLFTEIGTAYYAKHGYVPWPLLRHTLPVPGEVREATGITVRAAQTRDLAAMRRLYEDFQGGFAMALERPAPYWRHLLSRARWRQQMLAPDGAKKAGSGRWIAERGGRPVAYARVAAREDDLSVTEAAHAPGEARALAHLLTTRAHAEARTRVSLVGPASLVSALSLPVTLTETVDKMMVAPLSGRTPTPVHVQPVPHCFWPEDWF